MRKTEKSMRARKVRKRPEELTGAREGGRQGVGTGHSEDVPASLSKEC